MSAVAPLTFLVPILAAGAVAFASPWTGRRFDVAVALTAMLASAALCAVLLGHAGSGRVVVWLGGWHPREGVAFGIDLAADPFGAGLALFAALLAVAAFVLSWQLIVVAPQQFHAVALLFVAGMIAFCLTGDLFDLFVFFELMSVAAYVLVGYEVRQRAALEGSLTFAVTNTVGSILLLFGIALVYGKTGYLNLAQIGRALAPLGGDRTVILAFALIAAGLLVKAAAVPFHFWVADAYAVAPTPVCILLAGVFSELGLYGLARVWWTCFAPALGGHEEALRVVLVSLGVLTGLVGGALALAQHHLKRMLAYVTIAQIGVMLIGIGLLSADGLAGVAVFVVGDGLVKATLFACVAVVQHRYDFVDVRALHGSARELRVVGALYGLAALAVAGLPPFGAFVGRAMIEDAALAVPGYAWIPAGLALVSALSAGALLGAGARVFRGWGARAPRDMYEDEREQETADEASGAVRGASPWLWGTAVALLAAGLLWGLVPGLVASAGRAAARFTDTAGYAAAVLGGGAAPASAPTLHWPGATGFLYALASLAGALTLATLALRPRPLPRRATTGVDRLRSLHSGHPGDYVAFATAGATVLGGLFALTLS